MLGFLFKLTSVEGYCLKVARTSLYSVAQARQLDLYTCLGFVARKMAHASPEPGIPHQEGWIQEWIQAAVNTCKAWKQASQNNPFILAFVVAFSPFILIFMIFMLPLFIILICALSTALICFLTVCFFLACGLPVYLFTAAYGVFFMMFVIWKLEPVVHCIQWLYVNIMSVPFNCYRRFNQGMCKVFTQYIQQNYGGKAIQH